MGDRVSVTLTVLTSHAKQTENICSSSQDWKETSGEFTYLTFYEVNYGELDFLYALEEAGISYTSEWDQGGDFAAGNKTLRFDTEGNAIIKEVYDKYANPDIDELIKLLNDHEALKQFITDHYNEVTPLPWNNQEHNAKIYRARRLIEGDKHEPTNT